MSGIKDAILSMIKSDYIYIMYVDLDTGMASLYDMDSNELCLENDEERLNYDILVRTFVEEEVIEAERELMLLALSRDYVKWNVRKKEIVNRTYLNKDGKYCEMKCIRLAGENDDNQVAIGFSIKDEEIRKQMDYTKRKNFQISLMDGLSKEYHSVWLIHQDRSMELYRSSGNTPDIKALKLGLETQDYSLALPLYVKNFVAPRDRTKILFECTFYRLLRTIPKDGVLPVTYSRLHDDGHESYYQVCFSRAKGINGETSIVMAFRDVDAMINEQRDAREKFLNIVKERDMDGLTAMNNRLCYERKLTEYAELDNESVTCIYIDVDGLHELNNTKGHDAGDRMLIFVAENIQKEWGTDNTFRIGGDEFVIFDFDQSEEDTHERIEKFRKIITDEGYRVSMGSSTARLDGLDMRSFIKSAEDKMYAEKRSHYSGANDRRRR